MLFAHGYGCDQQMWRHVTPAFADFQTICFDHVGAGRSDLSAYDPAATPPGGLRHRRPRDLRVLDLHDVIFVGHSVAAMIGVLAANRDPERFAELVLVGPSPRYIDDDDYVGGFSGADIEELLRALDANYLGWSQAMAPVIMGNPDRPELATELTASFCPSDPRSPNDSRRATFLRTTAPTLAEVVIPTLVMQCRQDVIAPTRSAVRTEQITGSEPAILDATGHCPNLSAPAATIRPLPTSSADDPPPSSRDGDAFFDEAPCGFITATPDGAIRRVNRTVDHDERIQRRGSCRPPHLASLLSVSGQIYVETHLSPLLLNDGTVRAVALELVHADGHRIPVLVSATLARMPTSRSRCASPSFDATERRAYEQELLAARLRAEESEARRRTLSERCNRRSFHRSPQRSRVWSSRPCTAPPVAATKSAETSTTSSRSESTTGSSRLATSTAPACTPPP